MEESPEVSDRLQALRETLFISCDYLICFVDSELSRTTGHDWMEEISRKLVDFRISSARKASKVDGSAKRPKHDDNLNNDIVMGKENTPAVRKEYSHKPHADGSVRRPLQNVNHN